MQVSVSIIKVSWNTALPVCLHMCMAASAIQQQSRATVTQTARPTKPEKICYLALDRKCLLTAITEEVCENRQKKTGLGD